MREDSTSKPRLGDAAGHRPAAKEHWLLRCPQCNIVSADPNLTAIDTPCPRCGARGQPREAWPSVPALLLVSKFWDAYHDGPVEFPVLLFCSMFEVMTEDFLREVMMRRGVPRKVAQFMLDKNLNIVTRVNDLFEALIDRPLLKLVKRTDFEDIPRKWDEVRRKRNDFLHGHIYHMDLSTLDAATDLLVRSLAMFAWLHNEYCLRRDVDSSAAG